MSWETRGGQGRYYTRSQRLGRRIVREYIGIGPFAEAVAERDAEHRTDKRAKAEERRREQERLDELYAPVKGLKERCDMLAKAVLSASGFHRHKGTWRKRRRENEGDCDAGRS